MDEFKKPSVIDGYTSVQALRLAGQNNRGPRFRPSRTTLPATEKAKTESGQSKFRPSARINHTIIPEKYEIVCYECEYNFTLPGHIHNTICPKCHHLLELANHVIEGKSSERIRTIGTIEITSNAILNRADLVGRDVILAGDAKEAVIRVSRCLTLCPGAKFDIKKIRMKDLCIRSNGKFTIRRKIACRNLEVEGKLNAKIYSDGMVTIKPGGLLHGEIHGPHLVVEEGGGLKAKVVVGIGKPDVG
ncbi:polymer-forming cytoskeletal protein [Verrucomicrobiota bacterium]